MDQLTERQGKEVLKKIPSWSKQSASLLRQQRRIYILGKQLGMDREEVQKYVSTLLGFAVTSLKQLSYQQAEQCMKDLEDEIQEQEQEKESS